MSFLLGNQNYKKRLRSGRHSSPLSKDEVPKALHRCFDFTSQHFESFPNDGQRTTIKRTCLRCGTEERTKVNVIRRCINNRTLTGLCLPCASRLSSGCFHSFG